MKANITAEKQFILAGMSFFGDPFESRPGWDEENEIGRLWSRFMAYIPALPKTFFTYPDTAYEVHLATSETETRGAFEVFVGMDLDPARWQECPFDLCVKVLPLVQYAVFTRQGEAIVSDWEKDIQDWLAANGYASAYPYNFQLYDSRFKGMHNLAESVIDIYIPIKKKL